MARCWAWAATLHLGLPPEVLLHEGGYQGRSQDLLTMHSVGIVPGLRGLCEMGLTSAVGFGGAPDDPQYPTMRRWLRA